ncbi:4-(cytidine 5'-diphospho)-2-C-methyl-D-erythritol kinase [Spelaeicoccus albus]|uniref:4-diphosphocytidyl-2-C-methyl-D-erythritol kinase n=1 Tax=Spelaeicoccus albus TaxID=1280376 RepID=A0A7Z0A9Y3_9MICO|nr:4-(cytidine 5'-diphospho)-2-C-methyl-D-erythritol kinase [Spelaeicoccus albus]NYI65788.1 4-diphosphocytidyl-2-C-methyl-D-erythritol kinase [Spelaeicoccus albus]
MAAISAGKSSVTARAPGKINLHFGVGPLGDDGYHDVASVYQAVTLYEDVTAAASSEFSVTVTGPAATPDIPLDSSNLAVRAARLLAEHADVAGGAELTVHKNVPVAGGMGGGSADAAAALLACDRLWHTNLGKAELAELAATLGADVPFALLGGTAVGTGHGDKLTPALGRGRYHWVLATSETGLSTPRVYGELDRQRSGSGPAADPSIPDVIMHALRLGESGLLAASVHNDLQQAATALEPRLEEVLHVGEKAGALAGLVSGSGPTIAFLVPHAEQALDLALILAASGAVDGVHRVTSPAAGARILRPHDGHPAGTGSSYA